MKQPDTADQEAALREIGRLRHELVSARAYFTDANGCPCGVHVDDAVDIVAAIDAALKVQP